ncbi:MAG: FAD/NAD(P)-binding protein [Nanoarchaeota archaeon]
MKQASVKVLNPYMPSKVKVLEFFRESPDNFSLTVGFKKEHEPGQFVMVSLPGIGEAAISIASYSNKSMKLNIREVGSVTDNLAKLRKGDSIFMRGPYGRGYPMKELEGKNILMIGGGCGVAPLKGVVEYIATNRKKYGDITLFFGYRSVQDVLFTREIDSWKKHYKVMLSIDKVQKNERESCYDATPGFVTENVERANITPANTVVLMCGPPKMMELTMQALQKKGFQSDQLFVSTERLMQCAFGKCGHCMIKGKYVCTDGPVFRWDEIEAYKND